MTPEDLLRFGVGAVAALVLGGSLLYASVSLAFRMVSASARISVRWSAAAVVAGSFLTASFWLLVACGLFRLAVLVPWCLGAAWATRRLVAGPGVWARLVADGRVVLQAGREVLRRPAGWTFAAVLVVGGLGLWRGLAAPPLAWDALSYHLVRAGQVVQSGALEVMPWPDDWELYGAFPWGGDLLWAWALVVSPSGLWVVLGGFLIWLGAVLGLYAGARELGADTPLALAAAAAVGAMPAAIGLTTTAHVDNATWMYFGLGALFVLRCLGGSWRELPLACAALGMMAGVRLTTLPIVAIGGAVLFWAWLRTPPNRRQFGFVALGLVFALGFGLGAPSYLRTWHERGSPLYPVPVEILGHVLSPGSPVLRDVEVWMLRNWSLEPSGREFWERLLGFGHLSGSYINPGPGALLLPLLAACGAGCCLRRRRTLALLFLLATLVVTFGPVGTESMVTFRRTTWVQQLGRLVLPGFASVVLLAAASEGRIRRWALAGLLGASWLGIVWALPRGLSLAELPGLTAALAVVAVAICALGGLTWAHRHGLARAALPAAWTIVLMGSLVGLEAVRQEQRYPLYEDTSLDFGGVFHGQALAQAYSAAWPIWQALDRAEPLRLAVVTGWHDTGQNNYRFPLMGSRLQNTLAYPAPTPDDQVVSTGHVVAGTVPTSRTAWLERLCWAEIDYVVQLFPGNGIESRWLAESPTVFTREVTASDGLSAAFRFHRERLPCATRAGQGSARTSRGNSRARTAVSVGSF